MARDIQKTREEVIALLHSLQTQPKQELPPRPKYQPLFQDSQFHYYQKDFRHSSLPQDMTLRLKEAECGQVSALCSRVAQLQKEVNRKERLRGKRTRERLDQWLRWE